MSEVKVYSSPTCPHCRQAKKFLEDNNIPFEDYDVTSDQEKAEEMKKKSGAMSVPVLDIDGDIIVGFNESEIKQKLNL
ncbi:MAG: NrdH-redoxin [Candidatus Omnitrophica bacterium]|nr:NrdH-redoxin [Candidatus Omnitrophota bacterium]